MYVTTASQVWATLKRHARDEIATLRLQDLCKDNDRVSSLVTVHNSTTPTSDTNINNNNNNNNTQNHMLLIDLSRQRLTLETISHLLRLSVARGVRKYIQRLAWGQNNPDCPLPMTQQQHHRHYPNNSSSRRHRDDRHAPHVPYLHYAKKNHNNNRSSADPSNSNSAGGVNHPETEAAAATADRGTIFPDVMPSMHFALRAPKDQGLHMLTLDGVNALTAIHREWDRLERLSDSIRRGAWRGVTGHMIRDVVVVGRGVAIQALKFIYQALCYDETAIMARKFGLDSTSSLSDWSISTAPGRLIRRGLGNSNQQPHHPHRRIHFLTSVDPLAAASLVSGLDPGSTMVISLALKGNEETGLATKTMKTWLLQQLAGTSNTQQSSSSSSSTNRKADNILSKHMLLITGNDHIATNINKPESVFVIPEHSRCEAFVSFSSATLLPLSIVFGWSICEQFLAGGHDMDCHFVETNPRHNIPVLLALTDVWNDTFLGATSSGRVVTPFTQSMNGFASFVAALEAQACGNGASRNNNQNNNNARSPNAVSCSSLVLDGGSDGAYDRALYQSPKIQSSELIMVMNNQLSANTARNLGAQGMDQVFLQADALMCSLFGHADEMAFGGGKDNNNENDGQAQFGMDMPPSEDSPDQNDSGIRSETNPSFGSSEGNRPSTLLICQTLDAFACGQLVALSEHRAVVKARIWDIDPFTPEAGYAIKSSRIETLREDLQKIYQTQEMGASSDSEDCEEENGGLNLSTKTILGHYARVRN